MEPYRLGLGGPLNYAALGMAPHSLIHLIYKIPWAPHTYSHGGHRPSDARLLGAPELPYYGHAPPHQNLHITIGGPCLHYSPAPAAGSFFIVNQVL